MRQLRHPSRRLALQSLAAATISAPAIYRAHGHSAPSETVLHASFGAGGMAMADLSSVTESKKLRLVAVADVDTSRFGEIKKRFPDTNCYQDWRELLDKEKNHESANISTPDHMHAPITKSAMNRNESVANGGAVYAVGTAAITGSTLNMNAAVGTGAATYSGGSVNVSSSTMLSNLAGDIQDIYFNSGTIIFTNYVYDAPLWWLS